MTTDPVFADTDEAWRPLWLQLASRCGISAGYHDIWGNYCDVPTAGLKALIAAMGVTAATEADLRAAISQCDARQAQERERGGLEAVTVLWRDQAPWTLNLQGALARAGLFWRITLEDGSVRQGLTAGPGQLDLPADLPPGYHVLEVLASDGAPSSPAMLAPGATAMPAEVLAATLLIHSPGRCYLPPAIEQGQRVWGPALQLYALRSRRNWGAGDFTDLIAAAPSLAQAGAALIGLNPLHALHPSRPAHASPYSPSSRAFGNVMVIDVEAVPEFAGCAQARRHVADGAFQDRLQALRDTALVDYAGVAQAKMPVLDMLYAHFRKQHLGREGDPRHEAYHAFLRSEGDALQRHALFEALQEYFHARDAQVWGWPVWPQPYRDPASAAVAAFARDHADRVGFYQYLQWLFRDQLAAAQQAARSAGMVIGLYQDLAVSIDSGGAESWARQGLYAAAASAGCPPDDFNLNGQDWGLLPFIPRQLMAARFAPFIAALRANMRSAGALRLDHVMGLSRLFWVPRGQLGTSGAYVTYPFDHLMAIVTLESERHGCMIIGEDLGTVPDNVRIGMQMSRTLAYRVLYFSMRSDGSILAPGEFPLDALVTVTTHDLATLRGYWEGRGIDLRERLDLYPRPGMAQAQREARERDRGRLAHALDREGLLPPACHGVWPLPMNAGLTTAFYRYLARSASRLLTVQPEDVFEVADQVNLPGTVDEYDNWRRKLPLPVEDWATDGRWLRLGEALAQEGRGRVADAP